jgi:fructose-bisphosphate aldolase, class I
VSGSADCLRCPPVALTFCFGRALAGPALTAWRGEPPAAGAGQRALLRRAALNAAALAGRYTPELELQRA